MSGASSPGDTSEAQGGESGAPSEESFGAGPQPTTPPENGASGGAGMGEEAYISAEDAADNLNGGTDGSSAEYPAPAPTSSASSPKR